MNIKRIKNIFAEKLIVAHISKPPPHDVRGRDRSFNIYHSLGDLPKFASLG